MPENSKISDLNLSQGASLATRALHADEHLNTYTDVAPAMHVSTTFRFPDNPNDLIPASDLEVSC